MLRRGAVAALVMTVLVGVYVWLFLTRVVGLLATGEPVGIVLGLAFALLPAFVLWFVAKEWWLALRVQQAADELAEAGTLPVDDLPRSPGGRIDREAATAAFLAVKAEVESDPERWEGWFHLGFAYDAAGDRRRARTALRKAVALRRTATPRTAPKEDRTERGAAGTGAARTGEAGTGAAGTGAAETGTAGAGSARSDAEGADAADDAALD